tara:strand:- start:1863 stop:1997 length:135 start_codon:yes stop_codon:yes gene_type:complete
MIDIQFPEITMPKKKVKRKKPTKRAALTNIYKTKVNRIIKKKRK